MNNKVLIIDDDEELCMELREILLQEGYLVDVAYTGSHGQSLIAQGGFVAVILDLKLPGLSGCEVLMYAKRCCGDLGVIVLSGRPLGDQVLHKDDVDDFIQEQQALQLADAVMNKPVDVAELIEKVRQCAQFR